MTLAGLGSVGAVCSPVLPPEQIYQIARNAGFPQNVAIQMTAIALRESSGCPNAHNPGNPLGAEDSLGLWQINVKGNPGLTRALGIRREDLFDPNVNAQAAYYLWGGNPRNLEVAWYINRPGYKERYEQFLPVAMQAAGLEPLGPQSLPPIEGSGTVLAVLGVSFFVGLLLLTKE